MINQLTIRTLTAIIATLTVIFAANSTFSAEQIDIEEVIVTASRTDSTPSIMPNQVTIIFEDELKKAISVSDSLSGVLETTLPGYSGSNSNTTLRGISLRGGNPLILIDGIPQYVSMFDSNKEGNPIDMDFVSKVEVIHGASAVQGIGGTGGIINLITKSADAEEGFSHDITVRLSTDDNISTDGLSKKITYVGGFNQGGLTAMLGYSFNDRGMAYDANNDLVGLVRYSGSIGDTESDDLFFKINYQTGTHSLTLMHSEFEMEKQRKYQPVAGCHPNRPCSDTTGPILTTSAKGWDESIQSLPNLDEMASTSIDYVNENLFSWKLVAQYYRSDYDVRFSGGAFTFYSSEIPLVETVAQTTAQSEKDGFRFTLSRPILDNLNITMGYDYASEETSQIIPQNNLFIIPPTELKTSSPFAYLNWEARDNLRLNAGIKRVETEVSVQSFLPIPFYQLRDSGPVRGGSVDTSDTLFNYGAIFDLTDTVSLQASYTEGFELAEVGRLVRGHGIAAGIDVANFVAIRPNIHENIELGLRYNNETTSFEVNWFEQKAPFGNSYEPNSEGILEINRQKTKRDGWNFIVNHQITDYLNLGISYAKVNATTDNDGDGSLESDLVALSAGPPDQLKLYSDFTINSWSGRFSYVYYKNKNFKNTVYSFDGYQLANLSFSKAFRGNSTFGIAVQNLFNEEYIDLYSQISKQDTWYINGTGRTLSFSYNIKF